MLIEKLKRIYRAYRFRYRLKCQKIRLLLENLGCEGFFIARDGARPTAKSDHELHRVDHRGRNYVNNFPFPAGHRSEA